MDIQTFKVVGILSYTISFLSTMSIINISKLQLIWILAPIAFLSGTIAIYSIGEMMRKIGEEKGL